MGQVRGGRWVRERENRRAYDEWRQTDGQRRDGGLLLVASGTTTTQHTLDCTAPPTAQADRFDILERSGWLQAGWC